MVVPSAAKINIPTRKRRRKNSDILVVLIATAIAVSVAWLVASSLLSRPSAPEGTVGLRKPDTPVEPAVALDKADNKESGDKAESPHVPDGEGADGEMHLSAKNMIATERPYLIYGTAWKKDATADLVFKAIRAGFRFIDTACQPKHYDEPAVGYGLKIASDQLGLKREDLFLQTKFTSVKGQDPHNIPYMADASLENQVRQSVHASLRNLKTSYIDSLVLHSPMPKMEDTFKVWSVFESLVKEGRVRQLGISNCYEYEQFQQIYNRAMVKPKVLQNRFYEKSGFDVELRRLCKTLGVQYQSFWTLTGNRQALASREWKAKAQEKGLTPQTLMYAYMMTRGHTPLSGTKDEGHMEEDVQIMLRFQHGERVLSEEEMNQLGSLLGISGE
ncbi:hypothetical protein ACHAWF_015312 [Thalassiosira exigua]